MTQCDAANHQSAAPAISQLRTQRTDTTDAECTIDADMPHGPASLLRHASIGDMCPRDRHHCIDGAGLASQHLVIACCNANTSHDSQHHDDQTFMRLQATASSERNIVATAADQQLRWARQLTDAQRHPALVDRPRE